MLAVQWELPALSSQWPWFWSWCFPDAFNNLFQLVFRAAPCWHPSVLPEITSAQVKEPVFILHRDFAGGHRSLFLPNCSKENIFLQCFLYYPSSPLEAPDKGETGTRNGVFLEKCWEERKPRQGWRWVEVLRAGAEGGTELKKGDLALTPYLEIAKLSVVTRCKDQDIPRLQSPGRQQFVHSPVFKARVRWDLGHIFVPYVFLLDNLCGFLVVMLWIHFSSAAS